MRLSANTFYCTFSERNFVVKWNQRGRKSLSTQIGTLNCSYKSANPEAKHTINLNKNIKNLQPLSNQILRKQDVHICWSFRSAAQQSANSCTRPLSLISILKTNILKNTSHKALLEQPGTVSSYQSGSAGAEVQEIQLPALLPAACPRFLCPWNGRRQEKAQRGFPAGNSVRIGSQLLLPALPDSAGCETGCKCCLSHYFLFHSGQNQEASAGRNEVKAV